MLNFGGVIKNYYSCIKGTIPRHPAKTEGSSHDTFSVSVFVCLGYCHIYTLLYISKVPRWWFQIRVGAVTLKQCIVSGAQLGIAYDH